MSYIHLQQINPKWPSPTNSKTRPRGLPSWTASITLFWIAGGCYCWCARSRSWIFWFKILVSVSICNYRAKATGIAPTFLLGTKMQRHMNGCSKTVDGFTRFYNSSLSSLVKMSERLYSPWTLVLHIKSIEAVHVQALARQFWGEKLGSPIYSPTIAAESARMDTVSSSFKIGHSEAINLFHPSI